MAILISAFPGCGKTTVQRLLKDKIRIIDSDSSTFPKDNFPQNYIEHIKENIPNQDVIFISSHETVRKALAEEGIRYMLYIPDISRKEEFLGLYKLRGNNEAFIQLLDKNFESFLDSCQNDKFATAIVTLKNNGEFIGNHGVFAELIKKK